MDTPHQAAAQHGTQINFVLRRITLMNKPFFIMLYSPRRKLATPVVDDCNNVIFFSTAREARKEMVGHLYAEAHGFEVHEMGNDV